MDQQGQNGLLATYREDWRNRGGVGVAASALLIAFYVVLYWEHKVEEHFGVAPLTALSQSFGLRNRWYLYGFLYSAAMVAGAVYYLQRHGNSRYNRARISVNVSVQIALGFSLPFVMPLFGGKELYFSYFWPLKYDYLYPQTLEALPLYFVVYTVAGSLLAAPVLALLYGKRWYCSWVCGCGGLANTFGDPWRHLTSKSERSWRFEKVSISVVFVLAIVTTALILIDWKIGTEHPTLHRIVAGDDWRDWSLKSFYGFAVGAVLAGVVGTGLYPLFGPRVWCRNFCPMAAMLGVVQKLGRYRITVKPGMCISCGNCSAYCEMGIDVRAYAQADQSFTRASCVGCGMCAHMCPRGVLKLESASRRRLTVLDS